MKKEVSNTIIKVTNNITMFFNVTSTTSAENCQVVLFRTGTRNRHKTKENACQTGSSQLLCKPDKSV